MAMLEKELGMIKISNPQSIKEEIQIKDGIR